MVGEGVARIGVGLAGAVDAVQRPAAVRVDEPAEQQLGRAIAEVALPIRQGDEAGVLAPRPVLGKEARPVLRERVDLDARAVSAELDRRAAGRHHLGQRRLAVADDHRVAPIESDPEPKHVARVSRDVAVPEIEAQQVGVCARQRAEVVAMSGDRGFAEPGAEEISSAPVANGRTRNPGPSADLAIVQPAADELLNGLKLNERPHRPEGSCGGWDSNPHVLSDNAF